jgi:hypothetical protein
VFQGTKHAWHERSEVIVISHVIGRAFRSEVHAHFVHRICAWTEPERVGGNSASEDKCGVIHVYLFVYLETLGCASHCNLDCALVARITEHLGPSQLHSNALVTA